MSGVRRVTASVLAILVVIPAIAAAQASITGVVTDESGGVLPGVTVEASSPVLIEKVRAVVTDSTGRYRIVDLRPGDYVVTAALPGFATVRREGITLVGTFTATVDMKLGVGNLQETVTVTGESPVVDVQSVSAQRSIDKQVIDAIPAGRNHIQYGVLIPGVTSGTRDVGGTRTLALTSMAIHGGRTGDQRVMVDGLVIRNVGSNGSLTNLFPDMSSTQEITIDYGAVSAETMSGGVRINYVPQQGGNSLSGRFFGTFVNQKFQADNFSEELRASGLREPNSLNRSYDVNPSIGGAILTDRVWFYGAARFQENNFFLAGNYYNLNAGDPTKWTYDPDFSRQALDWITQKAGNGRVTWQVSEKHKVSVHYEQQSRDIWSGNPLIAPESTGNFMFPKNSFATVGWTAPLSSRLLLEVRGAHRAEEILVACPGQTPERDEFRPGESPEFDTLIPVREQALGNFLYRGKGDHNPDPIFHCNHQDIPHMMQAAGTLSYVTGTHAFKVGIENFWGTQIQSNGDVASATSYRFNNAIPNQITQRATPFVDLRTSIPAEMGVFVQDKWTVNRLTLTGGLRFDYFKTIFREMRLGPSPNVPNRDFLIPESTWYDFKDLSPRIGAAYDIFGTGRTAAKISLNRYVTAINALDGNPVLNFAHVVNRSWTDRDSDYVPDCDLLNPLINGECGMISDLRFGQPIPSTVVDDKARSGWSNRPYNWEFSTGVQHELTPGLAVDVNYFRRIYGNFTVTDNRAVTGSDFDPFCIPAPVDGRLPDGGGYPVCDLLNLRPLKVGQVDNYTTHSDDYGKQIEHWNGVDMTVSARLGANVRLQGGVSTGRTSTDTCDIRDDVPESNPVNPYCHVDTKFLTQVKGLGSYVIPKIDVQLAATLQSLAGPNITSDFVASNALVQPSLGRPLSGGAANVTVGLISPGEMYGDRMTQVDLRIGKVFRFGKARTQLNFDLFNLFNANPVLSVNNNYSVWLVPTAILEARLFKISGQFDF
jgi:hypothetical protein